MWNLVSQTKERSPIEGIWVQGAEENILTQEGGSDKRLEKTT